MATRHQGSPFEVRALNTFIALVRATDAVTAKLAPELAKVSLTESQFGVLEALHHLGPMCQAELGRKILKTSGNMTMVIDNLEKRHLVRRERDESDRRYITVHLTPAGETLIGEFFPGHAARIAALMGALTSDEQDDLRRLCRKLGTSV